MIITGGNLKGRKLKTLKGDSIRSSTSLLKESLFNILQCSIYDKTFLDLFAGTGSVGIEALSRGARNAIFIEKNKQHYKLILDNLKLLNIDDHCQLILNQAETVLASEQIEPVDFIFIDPPYKLSSDEYIKNIFSLIIENKILHKDGQIILEHPADIEAEKYQIDSLQLSKAKKYGKSGLSFWLLQ